MKYALPAMFGSVGKVGDGYKCDRCGCIVMVGQNHWCPMVLSTYPYPWGGVTPPPNWYPEPSVFVKIRKTEREIEGGMSGKKMVVTTSPPGEAMRAEDV